MAYSKTEVGGFLAAVAVLALIAIVGFGAPLAVLLVIGLLLCCPLMTLGKRGGAPGKDGRSSAARVMDRNGRRP